MANRADLLFELGTEELPPVALKRLSDAFTREFIAGLESADLPFGEVKSYAAPRRLGLLISDCATGQPDKDVERRGPAVKAAFDADGNPTKAAEGFARSCGTTVDQLQRIETDKGEWLTYKVHQTGKSAAELLPGIAETALNKLPIPKRMRWGASEAQFVRPVHWLLFLHGDQVVPCTILDADAGSLTYGHRFHHPGSIEITSPAEYASRLEEQGFVIADFAARREKIRVHVEQTAEALGGRADMDDELLDEVTALNEWPVPIAGTFEEKFLEVPHEALVYTMKLNQKYFPMFDAAGGLMNHFITIANIDSPKPELIKEGNERVVRPRLSDAMFFWTQDGKKRLEDHLESLKSVVFQQKLGSMYEKSERVAALASSIAAEIGGEADLAQRAGMLSRCDLMTEMVYEFPAMQGIMGRYQAARDGESEELGQAMDEFYMPRYSGDQLPESKTGIAISLAERIDTLVGIFGIGMKPTGDKDPFALRRAALGALRIMQEHALPVSLGQLLQQAADGLGDRVSEEDVVADVYDFMIERLKGLYHEKAIAVNVFEAVAAVRPESTADFDRRINAVVAFGKLPEAESLSAANKRIRNILKKVDGETPCQVDPSLFEGDEERALHDQVTTKSDLVNPMLDAYDYEGSLIALADLKEPVDHFFDEVMVMADDEAIRNNRLALLNRLSGLFLGVADISRLQS
ncbi:MAG: glycine--tRNA ligase subunit beta [Sedimenticola sp.]